MKRRKDRDGGPFVIHERGKVSIEAMLDLNKAEKRAEREGWIDADDMEKMLGVAE